MGNITWTLQYYSILHATFVVFNSIIILNITNNILQYYMVITILLNITCVLGSINSILTLRNIIYNITQYYMSNYTILLKMTMHHDMRIG